MTSANIASLKAKLSAYLARVRRGEEVLVFDRKTPIARIVPLDDAASGLVVSPARRPPSALKDFKPVPVKLKTSTTELLREDRSRR